MRPFGEARVRKALPWLFLSAGVGLGLLEVEARVDAVRRGYWLDGLLKTREALREEGRVLRIERAEERRAAETRTRAGARTGGGPEEGKR
ncbi:MAG: hypothetical protein L0216_11895 [Planctomycetales bacterium]|nr:hypothetical protein [Planctomycetales bacterium]